MKLVVCANHSWPHCGGTERVIQQIAEAMVNRGMESHILSRSLNSQIEKNGVVLSGCGPGPSHFLQKISIIDPDVLLIYSDYFKFWPTVLNEVDKFDFKTILVPVGMNSTISDQALLNKFLSKKDKIDIITHSNNYQDYKLCKKHNIPVVIIPNGVDLNEFDEDNYDAEYFRKKYGITSKYIILCVSNFFPGKGQEFMIEILNRIKSEIEDFVAVFVCSSVNYRFAHFLMKKFKADIKRSNLPYKILIDISREDVIQAFYAADVFAFPSQKEVAPLVLLETMAAKTPWVSLPVGNASVLKGGIIIDSCSKDQRGNYCFNSKTYEDFASGLMMLLLDNDKNIQLSDDGYEMIENKLNWSIIAEKYYELFTK